MTETDRRTLLKGAAATATALLAPGAAFAQRMGPPSRRPGDGAAPSSSPE